MSKQGGRWWGFAALVAGVSVLAAGGVALGAGRARSHRGLSAARVLADQSGARVRVIVLLRNQHTGLPATRGLIGARAARVESDQSPLQASVRATGGTVTHSYRAINAFSAVVSKAERARLAASRSVAAVLPDVLVPAPSPSASPAIGQTSPAHGGSPSGGQQGGQSGSPAGSQGSTPRAANSDPGSGTGVATGSGQICGTPTAPILAPEGLSLIQAPQAQQIVTGAGVKVAFVAEGIDVDNPDFIRPDGSHVIVDYRDFTGQGTDAATTGAEAFGDASTIAAQGTVIHDLSKYSNAANPLPSPCDIILRGVAPGVSLVAMKVFPTFNGQGSSAFISTILQGMDWAVAVDHVNVLNESFGGDTLPDTAQDVVKQFNSLAEQAGVVVTVSTGDQGIANTNRLARERAGGHLGRRDDAVPGARADDAWRLSVERHHNWLNDNIATFSSSGFTQDGKTLDLVAPGNESFETCTGTTEYGDCVDLNGQPSNIRTFGGTSEAAPMTAGVAALVIEAYRDTHHGVTPSPQLVKQIILSTADDLNIPSDEQGAGLLNALAAVQAAESIGNHRSATAVSSARASSTSPRSRARRTGPMSPVTNAGAAADSDQRAPAHAWCTDEHRRGRCHPRPGDRPDFQRLRRGRPGVHLVHVHGARGCRSAERHDRVAGRRRPAPPGSSRAST